MRYIFVLLAALALVFLIASSANAAGRRGWLRSPADPTPLVGDGQGSERVPPGYPRYEYSKAMYPKYYYGFHARYMQNLGVPTGDVGLRGNGIRYNPW
jgi:hypothetical protein